MPATSSGPIAARTAHSSGSRALQLAVLTVVIGLLLAATGLFGANTVARAEAPTTRSATDAEGRATLAATEPNTAADGSGDTIDTQVADSEMTAWKAAVLGIVEGVTEYLPISSTGHLLVTQRLLGIGDDPATEDAADSYAIAIQFGAILAVLMLYRRRIVSILAGLFGRDAHGRRLLIALVCATAPAVVIGLTFERPIKDNLLGPWPVVFAWAVGGIVVLAIADRVRADRPGFSLEQLGAKQALIIGVAQVVAMWPGTSRSLVTILAALAVGATLAAAVEFSFLLGLVTLGGATMYEAARNGSTMVDAYGTVSPLIGLVFAFVAAALSIRWMVSWLQTRSLAIFGWERLIAAAITVLLLVAGTI